MLVMNRDAIAYFRHLTWLTTAVVCLHVGNAGCGPSTAEVSRRASMEAGLNRRMQLMAPPDPLWHRKTVTTQPAVSTDLHEQPYYLDNHNIVQLLFEQGPYVISDREAMQAARYGLEEFMADKSRLEPFLRVDAFTDKFPPRRDAESLNGEVVGGIEKETFAGAIFRVESGFSASRVEYGEYDTDEEAIERGNGAVIRGRIEVPFVGSRKYQDRVINAAYQESTARKAMLDYLTQFGEYTREALLYYQNALHHLGYIRCYENKLERLESLLADDRLLTEDRGQVQAKADRTRVALNDYKRAYRTWVLILLQVLGIEPGDTFLLAEPAFADSCSYLVRARTEEGRQEMMAEALRYNPTFEVLDDAIRDARLQYEQAVLGKYDITAYVQGTQFPMASEGFDDRVDGWQVGAGLSMRVNDQRVLSATRNKAQARIHEYTQKIEAERLRLRRLIATQSEQLMLYYEQRPTILKNIDTNLAEYEKRREDYLNRAEPVRTIEEVHTAVDALFRAELQRYNNAYYASLSERNLMAFTGEIYRLVGLDVGNGEEEEISGLVSND